MVPKLQSDLGRTVGLIIWMCEPLFYTGKDVVTEIGFCVVNGIVALAAKGLYAGALIKKRQYWLKVFQGISLAGILWKSRCWRMPQKTATHSISSAQKSLNT